jgi:hypothetical protein
MVILKRIAFAGLALAALSGCERDFSTSWLPAKSDSTAVAATKPGSQSSRDTASARKPPDPSGDPAIPIESLSASDLRLKVGETKPAPVTVLPADASSPLYEMTSSKPGVAAVTADGIKGVGAGSATITVHALDGSEKTTKFHVIVDAVFDICLLPCLCLGKKAPKGDGGGDGKGKGGEDGGSATEQQNADAQDCGG